MPFTAAEIVEKADLRQGWRGVSRVLFWCVTFEAPIVFQGSRQVGSREEFVGLLEMSDVEALLMGWPA